MFKLVILIFLFYIFFKVKKVWDQMKEAGDRVSGGMRNEIDDDLVKDPYCEAYFPKRNAIRHIENGEELYFCSEECREKYLNQ